MPKPHIRYLFACVIAITTLGAVALAEREVVAPSHVAQAEKSERKNARPDTQINPADLSFARRAFDKQDYAAALNAYRPLADQGNLEAQQRLGAMYQYGFGVTNDPKQAEYWYRKAAQDGNVRALSDPGSMTSLGWLYDNGFGVPQDDTQAVAWYRKAAEQDFPDAKYWLGLMYIIGGGVPKDFAKGMALVRRAAGQGHGEAKEFLARVDSPAVQSTGRDNSENDEIDCNSDGYTQCMPNINYFQPEDRSYDNCMFGCYAGCQTQNAINRVFRSR